jgi:Fe-Mn family superoxide dismutase
MRHPLAPLYCRPWTLNGISPRLIESHYEHNYGEAVRLANAVADDIAALDPAAGRAAALHRLKRDEADALNAMLLHELYFASLGGDGRVVPDMLAAALARDFGSVKHWRAEFMALAHALAGGSGWVLLSWLPRDGRLLNHSATDNHAAIAGAIPLLALDMYEHAYHLDFGANAQAYVAAFMRNIAWADVQARFDGARQAPPPPRLVQPQFADVPTISPEEVRALLASGSPLQIIDTRPRHYSSRAQDMMAGAVWRDPERIDEWMGELSKAEPVITFCVYGFHIGCESAATLRQAGFDARYMAGGHAAWKALQGPVKLFQED